MLRISLCVLFGISAVFSFNAPKNMKQYPVTGNVGYPSYVTDFIKKGKIEEGRKNCTVTPVKGNVTSYAGFFTVFDDPTIKSYMFFWYFPAQIKPENAPVMIWLQGGPGATSLYGIFEEHGPFYVKKKHGLGLRKDTWIKHINMLYVDNPVGTGFSYTTKDAGYAKNEDDVANNLLNLLHQFFMLFPDLQKNDFFVGGESYGGKYVPALANAIDKYNKHQNYRKALRFNLKGISIGNGFCDPENMVSYGEYLYQIGLIDKNGLTQFQYIQNRVIGLIKKKDFVTAYNVFDTIMNGDLTKYNTLFFNLTGFKNYFNYRYSDNVSKFGDFDKYIQSDTARRAIHVGNIPFQTENDKVEQYLLNDIMQSVKPLIENLLEKKYKVLIYNGQLDIIVAYPLTVNFLNALSWSGKDIYSSAPRQQFNVDGEIAGYYKEANSLIEVMVRDAGHMVPKDQPLWALKLITRFTYNGTLKSTN